MTKVRLFIAVLIPQDVRDSIAGLITDLQRVRNLSRDIRFVPPENWHFTLAFLGYQDESAIPAIKETILSCKSDQPYRVEFERLTYGPPGPRPRMIWLTTIGQTSEELGKVKKELEDELETKGIKWQRELRPYRAHITLARFPEMPFGNLPPIEKEIDWRYEAREIHLMKSTLKRTGAEYEALDL